MPVSRRLSESLDEVIARRVDSLTAYQDEAYAKRYLALVERVRSAEAGLDPALPLTGAVARNFFKLMAYKDEYEVARLYSSAEFAQRLDRGVRRELQPALPPGAAAVRAAQRSRRTGRRASTAPGS